MTKSKSTLRKLVILCVAAVSAIAVALLVRNLGDQTGAASVERLSVVWPDVLSMPKEDRIALAKSALACKLHSLPTPVEKGQVISCVRQGAAVDIATKEAVERMLAGNHTHIDN